MFIKKLKIYNFRNFKYREFHFKNKVNIFHGENGTGKTSILEAINYISCGKSFRKANYKNLINIHSDDLTVFIEIQNNENHNTIAVNKNKNGDWKSKFNSITPIKQAQISNIIPVVSVDPDVHHLIDGGPSHRRGYLDWLVFHVKHNYLTLWKKTYKCIKQLNSLYKSDSHSNEIKLWEHSLEEHSKALNITRFEFFKLISPKILSLIERIQPEIQNIQLEYKKGWFEEYSLIEQLNSDRDKNIRYGQILNGPHKMDIRISVNNQDAAKVLSRGQKKVMSLIFYIAYIQVLHNKGIKPVLCLDDFDAEIDENKLLKISSEFNKLNSQIFITSVHKNKVLTVLPEAELFHVKH